MRLKLALLVPLSCVGLSVLILGCSDPDESALPKVTPGAGAGVPGKIEFCAIRYGASVSGADVDRSVEAAQADLKLRKESRPYRFVKGVRLVSGDIVLLFEDLRLSDTFQVYLIDESTGNITESYALSGFYYEEHECPSARMVRP